MLILAGLPIGDAADASENLKSMIEKVEFIAAEDSRKFSRLCQELGIRYSGKIISFFEGNETERIDELTKLLISNKDVLVATDAGMPGISDPGYRLVRAAIENNIKIKVLPGPSAVTTALLLSGLPTDRFCFEGFAPRTSVARVNWFSELVEQPRTIIYFEAPHRITESLQDAISAFGADRQAVICREMSKQYEEVVRGSLNELLQWSEAKEILGEITVVVSGFNPQEREINQDAIIENVLRYESSGMSRKEAMAEVAKSYGIAKRTVFDVMVAYKSGDKI
jgi:16S rRNA (cytidine1402-2'-O)-methyltransferase